jgi:predicted DNA-binding antitoxin AbrB/MazE fold protein
MRENEGISGGRCDLRNLTQFFRLAASQTSNYSLAVSDAIEAIYEDGLLRPLKPLALAERTHVRVSIEVMDSDPDRAEWLAQSERQLRAVWDNEADDVYNELFP